MHNEYKHKFIKLRLKDKDMIGLNIDHSERISESPPSMIAKVEHL